MQCAVFEPFFLPVDERAQLQRVGGGPGVPHHEAEAGDDQVQDDDLAARWSKGRMIMEWLDRIFQDRMVAIEI